MGRHQALLLTGMRIRIMNRRRYEDNGVRCKLTPFFCLTFIATARKHPG